MMMKTQLTGKQTKVILFSKTFLRNLKPLRRMSSSKSLEANLVMIMLIYLKIMRLMRKEWPVYLD